MSHNCIRGMEAALSHINKKSKLTVDYCGKEVLAQLVTDILYHSTANFRSVLIIVMYCIVPPPPHQAKYQLQYGYVL